MISKTKSQYTLFCKLPIRAATILLVLLLLPACNPVFVIQAAYEQSKILIARRPIPEVISDPDTNTDDKQKLCLVEEAIIFAKEISLNPGETFTAYTKLEKDPVAWVVSASRREAFNPYTWWFPIVGSLPYKGYFDRDSAQSSAKELEEEGYETWVRGTAAFSTLGWFNDPLLSSTLKLSTVDVINTVLHETVHATVWIPGSVAFNESLANFVGNRATIDFFEWQKDRNICGLGEGLRLTLLDESRLEFMRELEISDSFTKLYASLEQLYSSDLPKEEKLQKREQILSTEMAPIRLKYPKLNFMPKVNNAEIMQRKLYLTQLRDFDRFFMKTGSSWKAFLASMVEIKDQAGDEELEAFSKLQSLLNSSL